MSGHPRIIDVTDDDFAARVLKAPGIVVVDFWAPWCAPCLLIKPFLPKLELDFRGRLTMAAYNRDLGRKVYDELELQGIPNIIAFKDGETIGAVIGGRPYKPFRELFVEMLAEHAQPHSIDAEMEAFFAEHLETLAQERDQELKSEVAAASAVERHDNEIAELIASFEAMASEIYDLPAPA